MVHDILTDLIVLIVSVIMLVVFLLIMLVTVSAKAFNLYIFIRLFMQYYVVLIFLESEMFNRDRFYLIDDCPYYIAKILYFNYAIKNFFMVYLS